MADSGIASLRRHFLPSEALPNGVNAKVSFVLYVYAPLEQVGNAVLYPPAVGVPVVGTKHEFFPQLLVGDPVRAKSSPRGDITEGIALRANTGRWGTVRVKKGVERNRGVVEN